MLSLNSPLQKLFGWFKDCSYRHLVIGPFIMTMHPLMHHISCRVFWWNIKSPRWLSPPTDQIWHFDFWLFPTLKPPLKGNIFQTIDDIQENTAGQLMGIGQVWGLLWRKLRCHCPMYNIPCIFFNKCLFLMLCGWIPSGQTSYIFFDRDHWHLFLFLY